MLHINVRLPVLLCAVKTVESDFRLCWASFETGVGGRGGAETALSQSSMPILYKQHNKTSYTLKYGPGLGKASFPVFGDNRRLRMRQPDL